MKKFTSILMAMIVAFSCIISYSPQQIEAHNSSKYEFQWYNVQKFLKPLNGQRLNTSIKWMHYDDTFQGRKFSAAYCGSPDLNQYGSSGTRTKMKYGGVLNEGKWGQASGDLLAKVLLNGYPWKKYYQTNEAPKGQDPDDWAERRNFYVTQFAVWSFILGWTDSDVDKLQLNKEWCASQGVPNEDLGRMKRHIKEIRAAALKETRASKPYIKVQPSSGLSGGLITIQGENCGKDHVYPGQEETAKLTFTSTSNVPDGTTLEVGGKVVATASGGKLTYKGLYLGDKFRINLPEGLPPKTVVKYKITGKPIVYFGNYALPPKSNYQKIIFLKLENYDVSCNGQVTNTPDIEDKYGINIAKVDENKHPIEGAVFECTGPGGYKAEATTDAYGSAKFTDLAEGTYTVKEIQAPQGYELLEETWTVKLPDGDQNTKTIEVVNPSENPKLYQLSVIKQNEDGDRLEGVTFKCWTESDYESTVTTDKNGIALFKDLAPDTYFVQEISTIPGYTLNPEVFRVLIPQQDDEQLVYLHVTNKENKNQAQIKKIDADTEQPLKGAKFRITGPDGFDKEFYSDDDGLVKLDNLAFGEYTVQEIGAPEGYNLATEPYYFTITPEGPNQFEHVLENVPIKNKVKIRKVDEVTGDPLKDAVFVITGPGGYTRTETTDELGYIDLGDVLYGEYTITEIQAPEGYQMQFQPTKFTVSKDGEEQTIKIKNKKVIGGIKLYKTDEETGEKLRNAKFRVKGPNGFDEVMTTNRDGEIHMDFAEYGTYTIQEVEAPEGYVVDDRIHTVEITEHNTTREIRATNRKAKGSVVVDKIDDAENPVEGATFELKAQDSDYVRTGKTDADGHLEFIGVPYGMYQLKETDAPDGFVMDPTAQNFTLSEDEQSFEYQYINRRIKGQLVITKIDKKTREPLAHATFEIRKDGELIKTVTTDESGVASLEQLPYGEYTVTEIEAPPGYLLNPNPQTIFIKEDAEVYTVTMENSAGDGNIEIIKEEDGTGKKLEGAEFAIWDKSMKQVDTVVTDENGHGVSSKLPVGTYYIQEVKAPPGYRIDPTMHPIVIGEDGRVIRYTMVNEQLTGKITIKKTDSETDRPLEGVKFKIYEASNPDAVVDTLVTDEFGRATSKDLPFGDYIMKEVEVPDGYHKPNRDWKFTINKSNQVLEYEIENKPISVWVDLNKTGTASGKALPGAAFQLYKNGSLMHFNVDGSMTATFYTDSSGTIKFPEKLGVGKYQLVEVRAPEGYLPAQTVSFEVTEESKEDIHFDIKDKEIVGNVELLKVDEDSGKPMAGITFGLYRADGDVFLGKYTTNSDGLLSVKGLGYGEYYFKELSAPHGYVPDDTKFYFMIQKDGQTIKLSKTNKVIDGDVELLKIDIDSGEPLNHVKFKLINASTNEAIGVYETGKDGKLRVNDLPFGKYYLKEIEGPEGYITDGEPLMFYIQQHGELITLTKYNKKIRGKIKITKTDIADGRLIPDCGFRIYGEDGKTILIEGKTNEKGIAEFELEYGKYYYQEFNAPKGYVLDNKLYPFEIKKDGEIVKAHMTNRLVEGTMELTKVDISDGELLPNAKFVIYDEAKNVVTKGVTDKNGIARFKLKYGKYYYQEFEAPNGYHVDSSLFPFEIKVDGDIVKCQMTNKPECGNLVVTKIDANNSKPLQGATFDLYDASDKKILQGVTNEEGELVIAGLAKGDYYIKEVKAPAGYQVVGTPYPFKISKDGQTAELCVRNYPYGVKIPLPKTGVGGGIALAAPLGVIVSAMYVYRKYLG